MDYKISLIITTYNRENALEVVFKSILNQVQLPFEVIVADDGSRSSTKELIDKYRNIFPVPLIHAYQPDLGFRLSRVRNLGCFKSKGDFLIFIDGDIIIHPKFILDYKNSIENNVYLQGSRAFLDQRSTKSILNSKDIDKLSKYIKLSKKYKILRSSLLSKLVNSKTQNQKSIKGCSFGVFKKDFIKVNGFNNDFTGWGHEDSEFITRLYKIGIKRKNLKFKAIAYHLEHPQNNTSNAKKNKENFINRINSVSYYCSIGYKETINEENSLSINN